jgi:hypothetical protein
VTNPFAAPAPQAPPGANPFNATGPVPVPPPAQGGAPMHTPAQAPPGYSPPAGGDPFGQPAPREKRPRPIDMYGHLIMIIPKRIEYGVESSTLKNTDGTRQKQDRLTADVIILDVSPDRPLDYGGSPEKVPPTPHSKRITEPTRFVDMYLSGKGLVSQCRDALAKRQRNEPGMVLGRLTREAGENKPWLLAPYTEEEAAVARQYLATVNPFE